MRLGGGTVHERNSMAEHCALIVDEDASFRDRLARLLALAGIELIHASNEDEAISLLERRRPVVVVLAVDLPEKNGFFLFNKVKRVQRTVPVVITTSTVSRADLKMHEKLRVHADLYIEKTDLSDTDLFDAVAGAAGQERTYADVTGVGEVRDEPEEVEATSHHSDPVEESNRLPDLDPRLVELLDSETAAILAEIDAESTAIVGPRSTEKGELSPERLDELEEDVVRLAAELEHAHRDARSSPFSSEFLSLREVASGKDKEILTLTRTIARRDGQVLVVRRKLTELATSLVEAQTERDEKRKAASALEELLETSRANAEQLSKKAESHLGGRDQEITGLKTRLADIQKGRDDIREEAAELKGRLESSGTKIGRLTEEAEEIRTRHAQELKGLTERLASAEGAVERERNGATESKEALASSRAELERLNEDSEKVHGQHEQEIKELTERFEVAEKALDKERDEAAESMEALASSRAELERLNEESEKVGGQREQEIKELTERFEVAEKALDKERDDAAESKEALASSRAELERLNEESEEVGGQREQEIKELTERFEVAEKALDKERSEAAESKEALASSRAELERLNEESEKVGGEHAQEIKELAARLASSESAVEKESNEATESKEALASSRAELERLNEESEKAREKHDQEIKDLTERVTAAEKERDEASKLDGQIEELHGRLERLNEGAEGAQERHEQETIKFEKALAEEREEAAATRQELELQLTEQHSRALEELEKKFLEERATAMSELEKKHGAQSDQVVDEWERSLADVRDAHEKELSTLRSNLSAMERAETEARESLKRASEESTAELEALEKRYEEKTSSLVEEHDAESVELEGKVASTIESKEEMFEELTAKVKRARKNLEVERRDSQKTQERYEHELSSLREAQTKNLEHAEQDKMTALAELSRKSKEARSEALELERARLQDTADEVQKKREEELAALEEQLRAKIKDGDAAHESALARKARDLDQMSAKHGEELADARRDRDEATAELSRKSEEAQTKALELERRRLQDAAAEVQKKHEEELAALEERRRTELKDNDAAHQSALTQKDRDLDQMSDKHREELEDAQRERELSSTEHAEALAALRKELDALGQTHRDTLAQRADAVKKTLKEVEAERDEAGIAADAIRAQLAESGQKHQTERRKLEQTFETRLSEREDEKQSLRATLEELERKSSAKAKRLSAALAREKQEARFTQHAARINDAMQDRHEREISELDSRHAHDAKLAEQTWMKKIEQLEKTLNEEAKTAASDQERQWTGRLETMRREYETSDAALRKEIEDKLAVSAHRSEDASRELAELKSRLAALSEELAKAHKEVGLRDQLIAATVKKAKSDAPEKKASP